MSAAPSLPPLPLVGRTTELREMTAALQALGRGEGSIRIVAGDGGVGKTRLCRALLGEAERRQIAVASGQASPVETGVPYALFADALQPVLRRLSSDTLKTLTRGVGELSQLFPWLDWGPVSPQPDSPDFRSRLHWHFTQFVRGVVARQPLVVVLEDLHWADSSSLELLHFVARQLADVPLLLYCTYNTQYERSASLAALEQSLVTRNVARLDRLGPLQRDDVGELVQRVFHADPSLTHDFATHLYAWTRGNPFFIEETLKTLVASGDLKLEEDRWTGWQTERLRLPSSVRDAVLLRIGSLGESARQLVDVAAVLGSRVRLNTLSSVLGVPLSAMVLALDELRRAHVLDETADEDDVVYEFSHPLIRETLYGELGRLRARVLHSEVAAALEAAYGADALEHADELAYHYARAQLADAGKAVRYLHEAGRRALLKYANREAADYLSAAVQRAEGFAAADELTEAMEELARARQRLGEYTEAELLWARVQEWALERGQPARAAAAARRSGLACFWTGRYREALQHYERGEQWAVAAADTSLQVRLGLARAACLQELGRHDEALAAAEAALSAAGAGAEPSLVARVHRTFQQIHLWHGDAARARTHGDRALTLAKASGDRVVEFMAHWAMGVLEGFSGNAAAVEHHVQEAGRLAGELRSPVLRAWVAEMELEYASARGDWDGALRIGEEAIRLARALNQRTLLPRLLVWTGLVHLGRSDFERGEACVQEAWQLAGAGTDGPLNVHAVLPAYIGRAAARLAKCDYRGAIELGEEGVALADRTGYVTWSVHRLLPIVAESYLWLRDLEGARRAGERLRRDSERLGHRLGLAWAAACDALVAWLGGDSERGAVLLQGAAEQLEAVPYIPDATRLRRQLAGRLAEIGEREAAVRELRKVHDRLMQLGAEVELQKARNQFREVGSRPPPLGKGRHTGLLTARELAVARLIAERKSAKAVARELDISVRTVDTHLANIYRKLAIGSREELTDLYREGALEQP